MSQILREESPNIIYINLRKPTKQSLLVLENSMLQWSFMPPKTRSGETPLLSKTTFNF